MSSVSTSTPTLAERWATIQTESPNTRIRKAAQQLGVSEAQLLATRVGQDATRLRGPFADIMLEMPRLGKVMALTRNEAVVIEKEGVFNTPQFFQAGEHAIGQVVGAEIDLRLFMQHWAHAYAHTMDKGKAGKLYSIQFFDAYGDAIFKVFVDEKEGNVAAYEELVGKFTHAEQTTELTVEPNPGPDPYTENATIDAEAFIKAWSAMTDTHQFFPLLKNHSVHRYQALQLAEGQFAWPVSTDVLESMLKQAKAEGVSIMAFVGNRGCLEIHTGAIRHLMARGEWYNIMDPGFNLHIDTSLLDSAYLVEKPTSDGLVTSLEFYNRHKELVVQFFGERKPGKPELANWRALAVCFKPQA